MAKKINVDDEAPTVYRADDYNDLQPELDYDKVKATRLAEASSELLVIENRAEYLKDIIRQNKKLHAFLWRTLDGKVIALHDIKDDHLVNIMNHLIQQGKGISKQIKAEARSRNLAIPVDLALEAPRLAAHARMTQAEIKRTLHNTIYEEMFDPSDKWGN